MPAESCGRATRGDSLEPRRAPPRASILACVWLSLSAASAPASDRTLISRLVRDGAVTCEPTGRFFCRNIHVSCSGRSAIPTFPFKLEVDGEVGRITSDSDASGIVDRYRDATVRWTSDGAYIILRPRGDNGYVKLLAPGSYSFRHYSRGVGLMSRGRCD